MRRLRRVGLRTLAALALCALAAPGAHRALGADAPPASARSELAARIEGLAAEIAAAKSELTQSSSEWAEEEAALERQVEEISERLLERALANERGRAELAAIEARNRDLDAKGLETALDDARGASQMLAEHLSILAGEAPGLGATRARMVSALESLADGNERAASQRTMPLSRLDASLESALVALADSFDRLHGRATSVELIETTELTARDVAEPIELIAAGGVSFAYRTRDGERIGWAIASPADASGFRFTEELDADTRSTLRSAFAALARGDPELDFVFDASGTLRGDALAGGGDLLSTIRDGGPVMVPIALVALVAFLIALERLWVLWREAGPGEAALARVLGACGEGRAAEAARALARERGCVARVLAEGIDARDRGLHAVEESLQASLLIELPQLDRRLSLLSMLAGVAPLLGLLGTVTGIIQTFTSIKVFRSTDPSLLAGGISEALITTAAGLIVAIPAVIAHGYLSDRADRIAAGCETHAALLLEELAEARSIDDGARATPDEPGEAEPAD